LTFFNSHYDTWCYLPLLGFVSFNDEKEQYLCAAVLRPGNAPASRGAIGILWRILKRVWATFPKTRVRVRLDGGFADPFLLNFLDAMGVEYAVAIANNAVLNRLAVGHPAAGMIAAAGAVSVGFGSFHPIGKSKTAPMLLATIGMCVSTLVGTLAGFSPFILAVMAALWSFLCGLLMALGAGASWVGLQSVIALLVVSAYPDSLGHATMRASLILAGGVLQTVCILVLRSIQKSKCVELPPLPRDFPPGGFFPALRTLKQNLSPGAEAFRYGLRLAVALAIEAGFGRAVSLEHGYWVPITVLLVLKPDFHQTSVLGVARIAGTLAGAALATLIAALVRPVPAMLVLLVLIFVWLCYSLVQVNYATFTVCTTIYIAFLLALAGLPEMATVKYRALDTIIGGGFALIVYALWPVQARHSHVHGR